MKQARTFIKVHDSIEDHPKIAPLSDAAFRVLITSWGWCRRHNTDGLMPQGLWVKRASAKVRQELLGARLVHDLGEQVEFHDYLDHQQSAAERETKVEQRREAGRAGGLAWAKRLASESSSESLSENQAEKKREEKNTLSAAADPPPRTDVEGLCRYFVEAVARNGVKATISEKWRTEARLLLDRDQRDKGELRAVIDWCTSDEFWRANILSLPKLREKYDQLRLAMERDRAQEPVKRVEPAWMR